MSEILSGSGSVSAPKGKRVAADVIDLIVIPILMGLILGLVLLNTPEGIRNLILVIVNIGWLIFRDGVYSPGRTMVGLKLVSLSGGKVTIGQAFLRNVLLMIPFILIIGYIIEIISVFAKGDRVADGWAKTRVSAAS